MLESCTAAQKNYSEFTQNESPVSGHKSKHESQSASCEGALNLQVIDFGSKRG